jgi:hypothetical protein
MKTSGALEKNELKYVINLHVRQKKHVKEWITFVHFNS